jgi:hypothetical protein
VKWQLRQFQGLQHHTAEKKKKSRQREPVDNTYTNHSLSNLAELYWFKSIERTIRLLDGLIQKNHHRTNTIANARTGLGSGQLPKTKAFLCITSSDIYGCESTIFMPPEFLAEKD